MQRFLPLSLLILLPLLSSGQNERDILRYSRSGLHGTARYIGLGGAFGALGADISSISSNPAGIALFQKNELAFTPSFNNTSSSSEFLDERTQAEQFELAVEQVGLSLTRIPEEKNEWESFHFGFSYERKRSFNDRSVIQGEDPSRSILDRFVRISNGTPLSELPQQAPFTGELAYQTYLMDPASNSDRYTHRLEGVPFNMEKRVERSGSMGEARISFGADREGPFYFGGSFALPVIDFKRSITHIETVQGGDDVDLRDLRYEEDLSVSGYGMNLQLGMIARPNDWSRFGLSARTPGILFLEEEWETRMKSDHGVNSTYEAGPVDGNHQYRIRTPYRITGSMAFFYKKNGLLSLEYHFKDHRNGKLLPKAGKGNGYSYDRENRRLKQRARAGHEVRAGLEWRIAPLYLRGGYGVSTAPVKKLGKQEAGTAQRFSVGCGYRKDGLFLDVAYRQNLQDELHRPADPLNGATARIDHRMRGVVITGGTRF